MSRLSEAPKTFVQYEASDEPVDSATDEPVVSTSHSNDTKLMIDNEGESHYSNCQTLLPRRPRSKMIMFVISVHEKKKGCRVI